jgi:hypothetical protein
MSLRASSAVAISLGVLFGGAVVGLVVGGANGAVRGFVVAFGSGMLAIATTMLLLALRAKHPAEDWSFVVGYSVIRAGSGVAAIWLALGGGATAGWILVAFIVAYPVWMNLMRRRRRLTQR